MGPAVYDSATRASGRCSFNLEFSSHDLQADVETIAGHDRAVRPTKRNPDERAPTSKVRNRVEHLKHGASECAVNSNEIAIAARCCRSTVRRQTDVTVTPCE